MNAIRNRSLRIVLLLAFCSQFAALTFAYDNPTHEAIALRAVQSSSLDTYLKNNLGFKEGIAERIQELSVRQRVSNGALSEDVPDTRVLYHFHNPLQPWSQAGLTVGGQLG